MKFRFLFLLALLTVLLPQKDLFAAYGITSIGGSGYSGTLNYSANSTIYLCYGSSVTLYSDVPASTTVGGTVYSKRWQTSSDGISWFTTSSSVGMSTTAVSQYYRCVQRSTGGVVLAGSETPWARIIFGPSYVSLVSAVSTTGYTGTQFDAHWNTSSAAHGPGNLNIRHYLFCSTTSNFQSGTQAPGFNTSCAKLITACSDASAAIAGCTNPSSPVTYTVTGLTPGVTYYWKVLAQSWHEETSNGDLWCGVQSSYSATQTVSSCSGPQISSQPMAQAACQGGNATFSVTATGTAPFSYQWRLNGANISGATNSTFALNPVTAADTGFYTVYITNDCGNITSTAAHLTMGAAPLITSHPADITDACQGGPVSFSVAASGNPLTYQWQLSTNGGITYANITSAGTAPAYTGWTSATLGITNFNPLQNNGDKYRCIVASACLPNDTSDAASLWISDAPGAVTVTGGGTHCGNATLTANGVSGFNVYFQGTTSGGTSMATPSNSQVVTVSGTYYFRSESAGCWGPEGSATVTIHSIPGAVSVSGDTTQCGGTAIINASGGSGGTIYWQGTTSQGTSTATASTSQIVGASGIYFFRAYNQGCWGAQDSAIVAIMPEIGTPVFALGSTSSRCQGGGTTAYSATAANAAGLSYSLDGTSLAAGNTIDTTTGIVTYLAGWNGISVITAKAQGCGGPKTTDHFVMTNPIVPVSVSVSANPGGSVCHGTTVTFSANASNQGTAPLYEWFVNGSPAGTNSSAFATAALEMGDKVSCRLISNQNCISGNPALSDTITMVVKPSLTPAVTIATPDAFGCSGQPANFTAMITNGGTTPAFEWYVNTVPQGNNDSVFVINTLQHGDSVKCRLTSNQACVINNPAWSNTIHIVISGAPTAEAGLHTTYSGTPVQLGNPANGPGLITWSPAAGLDNASAIQPLASPLITTTYTLSVNNNGCIGTDTVTVAVAGTSFTISGKTMYARKATAGNPVPAMPTYSSLIYKINKVIVVLKSFPAGAELARDTSNASGVFQFNNIPDGNYIISYDKYVADTMQMVNSINAVDVALLKYLIGNDTLLDPSRNFSKTYKHSANVDNSSAINAVDIARIKAKIGNPYNVINNFPKGNWLANDTMVSVAGANLNINLQTIGYGDYDASSSQYRDSLTVWSSAKSLPERNIILTTDESLIIGDDDYFEVPLRLNTKMNELSALGLELNYSARDYRLVSASMTAANKKIKAGKINPSLEEIIAQDEDILVTDIDGVIRVVFATTQHFDVVAQDEVLRLGFRALSKPVPGHLDFSLSGTGIIADQYGIANEDASLIMPKIFVQGSDGEYGFGFTAYPNPFSAEATLTYTTPESGHVSIKVHNALGELLAVHENNIQAAGTYTTTLSGQDLPSGIYLLKMDFEGAETTKTVLMKMIRQ